MWTLYRSKTSQSGYSGKAILIMNSSFLTHDNTLAGLRMLLWSQNLEESPLKGISKKYFPCKQNTEKKVSKPSSQLCIH